MRVLTVGNMYPPHHFGGYELVWRSAVEHLRAQSHDVRVLTTDVDTGTTEPDGPDVHRELQWHLRDGEYPRLGLRARTSLARHNHRTLDRHLTEFAPDVVSWWSMGGLSLTMLEEVRRQGTPAVAFVHDEWLEYGVWADAWLRTFSGPRRSRLAPIAERVAGVPARVDFAGASTYLFVSDHVRRHARGLGLGLTRTAVAHSGIHPDFLKPAPARPWGWRLLYVGRLDPRKGINTAVEALARLPPDAHLTIAGGWDSREEQRLRALVSDLGLNERVVFAGQCDRVELLDAYAEADAVVFPVRWEEPWGLVPLEAMGRGCSVVATGRGGSGEYLRDAENCLLAEADDPGALAAVLQRLSVEPALRARLREGGFETAARHTEPRFNAAVEAATLDAAAGQRPDPGNGGVRLRILHLGTGFRPLRNGGLIAYTEDLMAEQIRAGHDVSYLFSGRHYPLLSRPRLRRWRRGGVAMLEVINSPLFDHGGQPEVEVAEPQVERMVGSVIAELRPDVVHVQELAGFPSSVLDIARNAGVASIMSLQDYFPLCSAFKLFDADGQVCLRSDVRECCAATVAALDPDVAWMYYATMRYELTLRRSPLRRFGPEREEAVMAWLTDRLVRRIRRAGRLGLPSRAGAFQRRRDLNVERLNRTDRVVAMSTRLAEIYALLGVEKERLRTAQFTLGHIAGLRPRRLEGTLPVTFATLGGGESVAKGSTVLLDAARALDDLAGAGHFRLLLFGHVPPSIAEVGDQLRGVEVRGPYAPHQLDTMLDEVDVGIVPSVWEEAYGYAGMEFLAKGIPVLGNEIGGIVDYVRDGETGWLNHSCSAQGLAGIMRRVIEDPQQIATLNARIRAGRPSMVLPMSEHAAEMEVIYREVIAKVEVDATNGDPG